MKLKLYDYDLLITEEQFLEATGIKLSLELKRDDDAGNKVKRFLNRAQQFIVDQVDNPMYRQCYLSYLFDEDNWLEEDKEVNEYRLNQFAKAVIHQANYTLKNGEKSLFNGYLSGASLLLDFKNVLLAPMAESDLRKGGFLDIRRGPRDANGGYPYYAGKVEDF